MRKNSITQGGAMIGYVEKAIQYNGKCN